MEKNFKRTTVTSALPYANGPVHIGHLAGVYVPADIYVRYLRLKKEDVLFVGGSDEHGVPITIRARKEGITPQDVVDRRSHKGLFHGAFVNSWERVCSVLLLCMGEFSLFGWLFCFEREDCFCVF